MSKHLLIVDKKADFIEEHPDRVVINATDYIANKGDIDLRKSSRMRVINLCHDYDYLSRGYYCSLLAEARRQRCVPSTLDIINLNWKRLYQTSLPELNALLEKTYKPDPGDHIAQTFLIYFGRTENTGLQALARRIFDIFRFPVVALELKYHQSKWVINNVEAWAIEDVPPEKHGFFNEALNHFTGAAWSTRSEKKEKYWIAILHDPKEKFAPSNKSALNKFIRIGKQMNVFVELITKQEMSTLLEYDALLIRETTAIDHHTFRFAHKAEKEGLAVIDDPESIVRCCNKVFLHELLAAKDVPTPRTQIFDKRGDKELEIPFPVVLKIPDGSFSRGVSKVENQEQFDQACKKLFAESDIILAQEFVPSDFDWRIGVLGGKPLFACKYFMVQNHWQIYRHSEKGTAKEGDSATIPIDEVPKNVMRIALKAANLIGNGLYGVDVKEVGGKVYVIEVNDNPNIEAGVDDLAEGDDIYRRVIQHLIDKAA
ncbi:MAG: RimK family protein [Alphaproteobacteria bacterium]|nr:RimK family protein [Alphaproteobacteria bacterium]